MKRMSVCYLILSVVICGFCVNYAQNQYFQKKADIIAHTDTELLSKYEIVPEKTLEQGGYITEREALEYIAAIEGRETGFDENARWRWYSMEETRPLDGLDEDDKGLMMSLCMENGRNCDVLWQNELSTLPLNSNLTYGSALKYFTRLISETFGCTDLPDELYFTDISQTYESAQNRGLITKIDLSSKNLPIPRNEFYELAARAAQTEICAGGYSPYYFTYEKELEKRAKEREKAAEPINVTADAVWNDDMSMEWNTDREIFDGHNWNTYIKTYTSGGELLNTSPIIDFHSMGGSLSEEEVISVLLESYPQIPKRMEANYILYLGNYDYPQEKHEIKAEIKLPKIKMTQSQKAPKIKKLAHRSPLTIELADDGDTFIPKGTLCLMRVYPAASEGRKDAPSRIIAFKASQDADKVHPLYAKEYKYRLSGRMCLTLQTAEISGDEKHGFKIKLSPQSEMAEYES